MAKSEPMPGVDSGEKNIKIKYYKKEAEETVKKTGKIFDILSGEEIKENSLKSSEKKSLINDTIKDVFSGDSFDAYIKDHRNGEKIKSFKNVVRSVMCGTDGLNNRNAFLVTAEVAKCHAIALKENQLNKIIDEKISEEIGSMLGLKKLSLESKKAIAKATADAGYSTEELDELVDGLEEAKQELESDVYSGGVGKLDKGEVVKGVDGIVGDGEKLEKHTEDLVIAKEILGDIFARPEFDNYAEKVSNQDRLLRYEEKILNDLKTELQTNGGTIEEFDMMAMIRECSKRAGAVQAILDKIKENGYDDLAEIKKIKEKLKKEKENTSNKSAKADARNKKKSNKLSEFGYRKGDENRPGFERATERKAKKNIKEDINKRKKSISVLLGELKNKFNEFLEKDLKENFENDEIRKKFFQTMNNYEHEAEGLLSLESSNKKYYDKLRDLHSRIGTDLNREWSADKVRNMDSYKKSKKRDKKSRNQAMRRKFFERKFGKKAEFVKYDNGFPVDSFELKKFIVGKTKNDDEVVIVTESGDEETIAKGDFLKMIEDGYKRTEGHEKLDDKKETEPEKKNDKLEFSDFEERMIAVSQVEVEGFVADAKEVFGVSGVFNDDTKKILVEESVKHLEKLFKKNRLFSGREDEIAEFIVSKVKI